MEDVVNSPQPAPQKSANSKKQPRRGRIFMLFLMLIIAIAGVGYYLYMQNTEEAEDYPTALVSGTVYINEQSLSPATITIKAGESVTWINNDEESHQIASDPHPQDDNLAGLNGPEKLETGDSFTYTFAEAGTYTYHDELNPFVIKGTVIVE